ncbi:hypothetical protein TNCV_1979491 [Trichonephila clavipes]|nr:hypothetical protein TNCV_1979491 [Trichonephila clavipes]
MRQYMKERGLVMGRVGHTRENPEVLGDPRVMRRRIESGPKYAGSDRTRGPKIDRKRQTPVIPHGIKRTVPSSVASRTHKYRRQEFNPSHGTVYIAGPSHQQDIRECNPPTEESTGEEQESSMTRPGRPGQHIAKDTVQLRGDQSGLGRRQQ